MTDRIRTISGASSTDLAAAERRVRNATAAEKSTVLENLQTLSESPRENFRTPTAVPTVYLKDALRKTAEDACQAIAGYGPENDKAQSLRGLQQRLIEAMLDKLIQDGAGELDAKRNFSEVELRAIRAQLPPELVLQIARELTAELAILAKKYDLPLDRDLPAELLEHLDLPFEKQGPDPTRYSRILAQRRAATFCEQAKHGNLQSLRQVLEEGIQSDMADLGVGSEVMIVDPERIKAYYEELKQSLTDYVPDLGTNQLLSLVTSAINQKLETIQKCKLKVLDLIAKALESQNEKPSRREIARRFEQNIREAVYRRGEQGKSDASITDKEVADIVFEAAKATALGLAPDKAKAELSLANAENQLRVAAEKWAANSRELTILLHEFCFLLAPLFLLSMNLEFKREAEKFERSRHRKIEDERDLLSQEVKADFLRIERRIKSLTPPF